LATPLILMGPFCAASDRAYKAASVGLVACK